MRKKIVTIGGGGGHSAVVKALKDLDIELTVLCNSVDDGGGTGKLMQEYGVHSAGDFRRILVALAKQDAEVLNYRFTSGMYEGQTISNLLLAGLELSKGSFQAGLNTLREWLGIQQIVAPITTEVPILCAHTRAGQEIVGQANVVKYVRSHNDPVETLSLVPQGILLSDIARHALIDADYIIVTLGDLYSSIAPFFCIKEVQAMWADLPAKVIWMPNVAVTPGHIHYQTISGALEFLQSLTPVFIPDKILVHSGDLPSHLQKDLQEKGYGVSVVDIESNQSTQVIKEYLVDTHIPEKKVGDVVERSPLLYNIEKLKNIFEKMFL